MCDDHNGSPWISRVVNLKVRTTDEAFVSRFIVDFCGRVPAHDDDELCCARHGREDCWTCCSTTCRWQCLVRIAVGPATSEPGRPDRRGVRLDAWGGMTTHTKLLQGSELDTANEVVMEHGDTVLLKIPELGGGNFPGLGLFVEWPRMKVGALHGLAYPFMVMPVQQFPTHTMLISPIGILRFQRQPCNHFHADLLPDFVPQAPPLRAVPRVAHPATPALAPRKRTRLAAAADAQLADELAASGASSGDV